MSLASLPAMAQDWSFIDPLMAQALDIRADEGAATLFVDHVDPNVATVGLGFHYYGNREGGNAIHLNVGLFRRTEAGWTYVAPVEIFGLSPEDARFLPGEIAIQTMMQGPNDPRCCPTQVTRWLVDTRTGAANIVD